MADWTVDEHTTAAGKSYFAEFVAGLADVKDIKDAAVLIGALRALAISYVNRVRNRWAMACSSSGEPPCGYVYYGFLPVRRAMLLGGYAKKRTDTPANVLELMRARLKEARDEHQKSRAATARKKGR